MPPDLDIRRPLIHAVQIIEDCIRFCLVQSLNSNSHRLVDPKRLPASDRVRANERVYGGDGLLVTLGVPTVPVSMCRAVNAIEAVKQALEPRRELVVSGVAGRPEGVATDRRDGVLVQVSVPGRVCCKSAHAAAASECLAAASVFS